VACKLPLLVDLERAQKIQRQALQYDLPEDQRLLFSTLFMPYDLIGGDYYAIEPLDADRYGFLLADMEGHGVAAALYAMHLSILWNRHFRLLKSPADFAAAVNEYLLKIFGSVVTFATAMCGIMAIPTLDGQHAHLRLHEGSHDRRSKENVTADRLNALSTAALNGKPDPRVLFPH
jgi:hypothetical protein